MPANKRARFRAFRRRQLDPVAEIRRLIAQMHARHYRIKVEFMKRIKSRV